MQCVQLGVGHCTLPRNRLQAARRTRTVPAARRGGVNEHLNAALLASMSAVKKLVCVKTLAAHSSRLGYDAVSPLVVFRGASGAAIERFHEPEAQSITC